VKSRFWNAVVLLGVVLILAVAFAVSDSYQGAFIQDGYDPTMGNEIRFNTGTYAVPVTPASAITRTILFSVTTPFYGLIGTIPAGAVMTHVDVVISVAFNAGTTNVFLVGTLADPDHYVDAGDVNEALVSTVSIADKPEQVTVDTDVYLKYTQTGGAATTGAARATVWFVIPPS